MKFLKPHFVIFTICTLLYCSFTISADAGNVTIENQSDHLIKVASIGGAARLKAGETKVVSFENDDLGADINIWWVKNVRQLCQIFTPWDRKIIVHGSTEITCLSRN